MYIYETIIQSLDFGLQRNSFKKVRLYQRCGSEPFLPVPDKKDNIWIHPGFNRLEWYIF